MLETVVVCLNCGKETDRPKFCSDGCGSAYRNRKAWADMKDVPIGERRRSFYLTPGQAARPDKANLRRVAFLEALDEISDTDVVNEILQSIDIWTAILLENGVKQVQASNIATELVGELVWDSVNLPPFGQR